MLCFRLCAPLSLITLFALLAAPFAAAAAPEEKKPEPPKAPAFLSFTLENDSLGSGADRNYTSGVRIGFLDTAVKIPAALHAAGEAVSVFAFNESTSLTLSLGHNLYTPRNITRVTQDPRDRPWAAFLYASAGLATQSDDHVDEVELTLGVVGPLALGETVQKTVHTFIGGKTPRGWNNQLKNEPGVILSWQRRWPDIASTDVSSYRFTLSPHGGVTLGNIYTYGNSGLTFRFGPSRADWQDTPLRVRPATPGIGYFGDAEAGRNFGWYLFAGVDGRAVARNIFLDGNSFASSHSVDKNPLVADISGGLALTYGDAQIAYTLNWRSPEFSTQRGSDVFGSVSVGWRF
jgi:hypothetical protein